MVNRWIGITCLFGMLTANTALVFRDLVPDWLAGEPPDVDNLRLAVGDRRESQVGTFDSQGRTVGRSWTVIDPGPELTRVKSWTVLYPVKLPNGMVTPHVRIDTNLNYQRGRYLDSLDVRLRWQGAGPIVKLEGEFMEPDDFPCEWQIGDRRGSFLLRASATRALGDVFRPFGRLPGLYVGRSWRISLVDPLTHILPGKKAADLGMKSILVKVDGEETLQHEGRRVEVFHVISEKAEAWVARDGRVLMQKVELPLLGQLTLRAETYDKELRRTGIRLMHVDQ